ncbi:hypothetical protein LTR81_022116 [Elasticomyces elasticus]
MRQRKTKKRTSPIRSTTYQLPVTRRTTRQLISHNILVKQLNGHFAGSGKDFTDGTEFSNVICDNLEIPRESAFKQIQALGLKDGTSIVIGRRKSDTVTESAYMFQERSVMGEAFDQLDLEFAYVLGVAAGLRLESIRVRVFRVACKSRWFPAPPNMRSDLDIGRALTAMGKGFDSPNANNASKATEVMENLITPTGAGIALLCFHHDFIMILWVAKGTVRAAPDMTAMGTDFYVVMRSELVEQPTSRVQEIWSPIERQQNWKEAAADKPLRFRNDFMGGAGGDSRIVRSATGR